MKQGSAACAVTAMAKASAGRTGVRATTAWPDLRAAGSGRATSSAFWPFPNVGAQSIGGQKKRIGLRPETLRVTLRRCLD